jgi:hypothetical protein
MLKSSYSHSSAPRGSAEVTRGATIHSRGPFGRGQLCQGRRQRLSVLVPPERRDLLGDPNLRHAGPLDGIARWRELVQDHLHIGKG